MDKQIEEIVSIIREYIVLGSLAPLVEKAAVDILKKYQPKIPENAVVLTRGAYNKLEKKIADLSYDADFHKQQEERIVDLQYDKFELKQEISEKDNKIALLEETIECIKFNVDFTRKETAGKFAERLKEYVIDDFSEYDYGYLCMKIDGICKEIAGG